MDRGSGQRWPDAKEEDGAQRAAPLGDGATDHTAELRWVRVRLGGDVVGVAEWLNRTERSYRRRSASARDSSPSETAACRNSSSPQ